jgi:hypothetical protein
MPILVVNEKDVWRHEGRYLMQVRIAEKKEKDKWLQERDCSIHIKTRPNYVGIASLVLSAVILLGMLAVEWLPYQL